MRIVFLVMEGNATQASELMTAHMASCRVARALYRHSVVLRMYRQPSSVDQARSDARDARA